MPVDPSIKWVDVEAIPQLKTGDIIRGKLSGVAYVVTGQYGDRATAVMSFDVTNPDEWEVMRPADQPGGE